MRGAVPEGSGLSVLRILDGQEKLVLGELRSSLRGDPAGESGESNHIHSMPAVGEQASCATQWMNRENSFAEREVVFEAVEEILFGDSFRNIHWRSVRGVFACWATCLTYGMLSVFPRSWCETTFGVLSSWSLASNARRSPVISSHTEFVGYRMSSASGLNKLLMSAEWLVYSNVLAHADEFHPQPPDGFGLTHDQQCKRLTTSDCKCFPMFVPLELFFTSGLLFCDKAYVCYSPPFTLFTNKANSVLVFPVFCLLGVYIATRALVVHIVCILGGSLTALSGQYQRVSHFGKCSKIVMGIE